MKTEKYVQGLKEHLTCANMSSRTIDVYCSLLRKFLSQPWQEDMPQKITAEQLRVYIGHQKTSATMRQVFGMLGHFYRSIGQPRKLQRVPYPKKERKLPRIISATELNTMINAIPNRKHRCICMLLYGCGLRLSEVLALQPKHINGERCMLHVVHGKGAKDRMVPITPEMLSELRRYWLDARPKQYLFEGQYGGQYSAMSVQKICHRYCGMNPHGLRHCYATHLHEAGVQIEVIKELLGHGSVKTTMVYTHVSNVTIGKVVSPLRLVA